jgi:hypothetical protein
MSLDLRSGDALIDLVREGFGAPLSQEDQALCACRPVFSVHEPVALASALAGRLRVGPYAAQHIGGRRRRNLSRFRATIHLASRL